MWRNDLILQKISNQTNKFTNHSLHTVHILQYYTLHSTHSLKIINSIQTNLTNNQKIFWIYSVIIFYVCFFFIILKIPCRRPLLDYIDCSSTVRFNVKVIMISNNCFFFSHFFEFLLFVVYQSILYRWESFLWEIFVRTMFYKLKQ